MTYPTVRQWLLENTPLEPSLLEGAGFSALVAERITAFAKGDESAYVDALERSPDEVERLAAGVAVPETWLFRYPNSFTLLAESLARRLASGETSLRMCSIGCATGQEPYSMVMTAVHAGWAPEQISVDAFDRNADALRVAAQGRYGPSSIRGEIPSWAAPFFERDGESIRIVADIRNLVRFRQRDVLNSWSEAPDAYDIVFCRNVVIYLNADARARLLRAICDSLVIGGLLFVGHAEALFRGDAALRPLAASHAFAFERVEPAAREAGPGASEGAPPTRRTAVARVVRPLHLAPPPPRPAEPAPTEATLEAARDLADAGRMAESEAMTLSIIARRGPSAPALELLGMIRIAANDLPGARRRFEQAVYLEPTRAASLLQLALISERSGDPKRASALWTRARKAAESADKAGSA